MKNKTGIGYVEHENRVVDPDDRFKHVMAITLDPRSGHTKGVIRCIMSRDGDVAVHGFVDRSVIHKVHRTSLDTFTIDEPITNQATPMQSIEV